MKFFPYRLYYKKVLSTPSTGNIDGRYLDKVWTPSEIIFKGRTQIEAMKKANKFWQDGQFGMGSICVIKE